MGLAPSTTRVPTTEPTIFSFSELDALTPLVMPVPAANCAVSITVKNTPPSLTNFCSLATQAHPSPGRRSSVESFLPTRFGVSAVFCHGSEFPQLVGTPLTILFNEPLNPTGGNKITSYFSSRSAG